MFDEEEEKPDAIFYPTLNTINDLYYYKEIFMCIKNPEDFYVNGNYDTSIGSSMQIVWERCDPKKNAQSGETKDIKCVDDDTYKEWGAMRYLLSVEN